MLTENENGIEIQGGLTDDRPSETHTFEIPANTKAVHATVRIHDGNSKLTFQWNDPIRSRGFFFPTDKEWGKRYDMHISRGDATKGLMKGPIVSGPWTIHVSGLPFVNRTSYSIQLQFISEPTVRGHKWYAGDLHIHTNHSDGVYSIFETIRMAKEAGLQYLCITDHNTISGLEELDDRHNELQAESFLVIQGVEYTSSRGHANAIGLKSLVDWRVDGQTRTFADVASDTRKAEGLFSINHPFHAVKEHCWWEWDIDYASVDCMEIWNSLGVYRQGGREEAAALSKWNELLNAGYRITGIGGSDSVHAGQPADHRPGNPITYVFAEKLTEADIMKGIKEGRVVVSKGPRLIATVSHDGQRYEVGDRIRVRQTETVTVHVNTAFSQPHLLQLLKNGEIIGERAVDESSQLEWHVDVRAGDWLRTQAWDLDGKLLAFTNPLYVI